MPRRAAIVTQADVSRTIRAMQALGLSIVRVVVRPDGVAVETVANDPGPERPARPARDETTVTIF